MRRCSILLDIKEMQRNDYLPTRIADMEMPTDLGVGGDLTQLSFSKRVGYWNHLHRPVQCFFLNKAVHTAYHVIQHFYFQQYDQQNSIGICPSMGLEENTHTSIVPKISKLRSKKEFNDCHRKKNKQVLKDT